MGPLPRRAQPQRRRLRSQALWCGGQWGPEPHAGHPGFTAELCGPTRACYSFSSFWLYLYPWQGGGVSPKHQSPERGIMPALSGNLVFLISRAGTRGAVCSPFSPGPGLDLSLVSLWAALLSFRDDTAHQGRWFPDHHAPACTTLPAPCAWDPARQQLVSVPLVSEMLSSVMQELHLHRWSHAFLLASRKIPQHYGNIHQFRVSSSILQSGCKAWLDPGRPWGSSPGD